MKDLEDYAWIVWCILLSALIFYLLVQTAKNCTKMMKARENLYAQRTHQGNIARPEFTSTSPIFTISHVSPSINVTPASSTVPATTTRTITTVTSTTEKSNDGLPSYEEALQIMMTPLTSSVIEPIHITTPPSSSSSRTRSHHQPLQYVNSAFNKVE